MLYIIKTLPLRSLIASTNTSATLIVLSLFLVGIFDFWLTFFEVYIAEFLAEIDTNGAEWYAKWCFLKEGIGIYIRFKKFVCVKWFY